MSARTTGRKGRSELALRIEGGKVSCPRRGIIDIEDCWVCREYGGLADGRVEFARLWPVGGRHRRRVLAARARTFEPARVTDV